MTALAQAIRGAASWRALVEMTKPRLSSLVLFTTLVGFAAAADGGHTPWVMLHAMVGTALVAGGANVFNQILEREHDAKMHRTEGRPLPTGRANLSEAARFAIAISSLGILELLLAVNLLTAFLGAVALVLYVFVYTPLKRITIHNTLVGAVVGALPPLMGWTAAQGELGAGGWALFAILFVWQLPHFYAIAWIYREDYARGGYRMLSVVDPTGRITGVQVALLSLMLIPVSLLPTLFGVTGRLYFHAALLLGIGFWACCLWFSSERQRAQARRSFIASIIYLPSLLTVMLCDLA